MKKTSFKFIGALRFPVLFGLAFSLIFPSAWAQVSVSVQLRPAPPQNASAVRLSSNQVQLTWDPSPSSPSLIDSYSIFVKLSADPFYPLAPHAVRFDSLPAYSELISVNPGVAYDFKVFANSDSGLSSPEDCPSCEASISACGNGLLEAGEACDGGDFGGFSCADFGSSSGNLTCLGSCQVDWSACVSPLPSGTPPIPPGGRGGFLRVPPSPGQIDSPPVASSSPILVRYSEAKAFAPKTLSRVRLYYKKAGGEWTDSELASPAPSGSFQFIPRPQGEAALYSFALMAYDNWGDSSLLPIGQGDAVTDYRPTSLPDRDPPLFDALFLSQDEEGIQASYRGARDEGQAGLKKVEIWYKKGVAGDWLFSGLSSPKESDSFVFSPSSSSGTYYFALVLEDALGNRTEAPSGEGQGSVSFLAEPFEATLTAPEGSVTASDSLTIVMGGKGIVAYRYKLNDGPYGEERPVQEALALSGLKEGNYTLAVIGKGEDGSWQDVSSPTLYRWAVDFSQPRLEISGPVPSLTITRASDPKEVAYTLSYSDFDTISLDLEDIYLIKTGTAEAFLSLSKTGESTFSVVLGGISGFGTLRLSVAPGTADHENGNFAFGIDSSPITLVSVDPPVSPEPLPELPDSQAPEVEPVIPYSYGQVKEKAREAIFLNDISFLGKSIRLPSDPRIALDQCRSRYPAADFGEGGADEDFDGLSGKTECYAFTDPENSDSDSDGCADGDELAWLSSDPAHSGDCPFAADHGRVFISSPQSGWTVSDLGVLGLVPEGAGRVYMLAFPVLEGRVLSEQPLELGSTTRFSASSLRGYLLFETSSELRLPGRQSYELVAVAAMRDGSLKSSRPVRFRFDPTSPPPPPELLAINRSPYDSRSPSALRVYQGPFGKIQLKGKSLYGNQIFALWQSQAMISSVLVDSPSGEFSIRPPHRLDSGELHRVTLYALAPNADSVLRSKPARLNFMLEEGFFSRPGKFPHILFPVLFFASSPLLFLLWVRRRKKKKRLG